MPGNASILLANLCDVPERVSIEASIKQHGMLFTQLWACRQLEQMRTQNEMISARSAPKPSPGPSPLTAAEIGRLQAQVQQLTGIENMPLNLLHVQPSAIPHAPWHASRCLDIELHAAFLSSKRMHGGN